MTHKHPANWIIGSPFVPLDETKFHSGPRTIRVQNDLLRAVDTHGGAILVLLELSAAFDTIDHHRLLHTLESSFGIQGKALDWFHSYLTGRTQT